MRAPLLDDLVEPFERISERSVLGTLHENWSLVDARLTLLDTERDDSFRVDVDGRTVLVKVAHPNDGAALLDLQDQALATIAAHDPELPVPRAIPSASGETVTLDGRIVRVLTWLPGSEALLGNGVAQMPLRAGGEVLGRLSRALAPLVHPAATRVLPWDLARVPELLDYTSDARLVAAITRFEADVTPVLSASLQQIVHGDFHPGNVLIDDAGAVSGVVDFGDVSRTARVCDAGVALGYLIPDDGSGSAVRDEFLTGFESVVPLSSDERAAIPGLVAGRQIQRIIINDELGRRTGRLAHPTRLWRLFERAMEDWA